MPINPSSLLHSVFHASSVLLNLTLSSHSTQALRQILTMRRLETTFFLNSPPLERSLIQKSPHHLCKEEEDKEEHWVLLVIINPDHINQTRVT